MKNMKEWLRQTRSNGGQRLAGRLRLSSMLVVLLLVLSIAACGSQTPPIKAQGIIGRGGADPFWTEIANKARTGGASAAIAWAESFQSGQPNFGVSSRYSGYCLEFVANAYGASFSTPYNTAWQLARASTLHDPHDPAVAPQGALMFFDLTSVNIPEGHVGISLGGGAMISALEHAPNVQITPSIQSSNYWKSVYRGWAWPPSNWGPLAVQAASGTSGGSSVGTKPSVLLQEGLPIDFKEPYAIFLTGFAPNTSISVTCYDSTRPSGFHTFTLHTDASGSANSDNDCFYAGNRTDHWVIAGGVESNHLFWIDGGIDGSGTPPNSETAGNIAHTWTDYIHAGGIQGPSVPAYATIQIACKVTGFRVADGNTWWYRIASSPWNSIYYVSADVFYNNGQTSGSLKNTPWVDSSVPACTGSVNPPPPLPPTPTPIPPRPQPTPTPIPPRPQPTPTPVPPAPQTWPETAGGVAHTWTNYTNAGGTEGPSVAAYQTVQIACKLTGFRVADGNTWWYRIAQSPWNNQYYVSADAFYNNGQTSGSLSGTPWVDPNVPNC